MYQNKKVLLIAGGGTLGTYAGRELLEKGCSVDVICLEDHVSENPRLRFFKESATLEMLTELLSREHYDGIINFLHFPDVEEYKPYHRLLSANTDHLIFLSSYRVYADLQHPITESAPMLLDVSQDQEFLEKEDYALAKARAEYYIRNESGTKNWTIVRPVISTSFRRFDLVTRSGKSVLRLVAAGEDVELPLGAKELTAGVDWAGNTGKLIANLLFKPEAVGEAFTVSSGQNITWGQVADIYAELIGARIKWIDTEEYIRKHTTPGSIWGLIYDRLYERDVDNSKILRVTGLTAKDFLPLKEGIQIELASLEA